MELVSNGTRSHSMDISIRVSLSFLVNGKRPMSRAEINRFDLVPRDFSIFLGNSPGDEVELEVEAAYNQFSSNKQ